MSINSALTGVVGVPVGAVVCMVSGVRAHVVAGRSPARYAVEHSLGRVPGAALG